MPTLYVVKSPALQEWGSDVGVSKHVYKLGLSEEPAADAVKELNDAGCAGQKDWQLVAQQAVDETDEAAVIDRLAKREKMIDPLYYPKIKGVKGIFKVNPANAEAHFLVKKALAGEDQKSFKLKPADVGTYLIQNALK